MANDFELIVPDFVVVGAQYPGRVVLLASRTLTQCELKRELEFPDNIWRLQLEPKETIILKAIVEDYVEAWGPDYPTAWAALFAAWGQGASIGASAPRKELHDD